MKLFDGNSLLANPLVEMVNFTKTFLNFTKTFSKKGCKKDYCQLKFMMDFQSNNMS